MSRKATAATDPTLKSLLLENVPRDLFDRALEKCRRQEPPIALKWKIVELVRAWTDTPDITDPWWFDIHKVDPRIRERITDGTMTGWGDGKTYGRVKQSRVIIQVDEKSSPTAAG